jgi:hypothetical protein
MSLRTAQLFLITALFVFTACSSDDNPIDNQEPDALELSFTTPPFELSNSGKFAEDISYDEDVENQFDIFIPESENLTGIEVYIHGGSFVFGDNSSVYVESNTQNTINSLLENNQAFASINYHLFEENETEGVIASLNDAKRCLQFIRFHADVFNVNKENIVLMGNSAGAGTALWIAFNPEMANHDAEDAILQESTRVKGAAVVQTQATYDLQRWEDDIFDSYNFSIEAITESSDNLEQLFLAFYGIDNLEDVNSPEIQDYRDAIDMLDLLTSDDPEFFVDNTTVPADPPTNLDLIFHHPFHAKVLQERAQEVNAESVFYYGQNPPLFEDPSGETELEFLLRKLSE